MVIVSARERESCCKLPMFAFLRQAKEEWMSEERRKIAFGREDGSILILKTNTSVSVTDGLNSTP
jgi:hypothetical protein